MMSNAVAYETDFEGLIGQCREIIDETSWQHVRDWKAKTGGKAVGCFPVYCPIELIYANGVLPVGLNGAGTSLDIERADALFGSFACSIVKTTTEMAMRGVLKDLDGIFFHSICDAARNLASVFKGNFSKDLVVEYLHLAQNPSSPAALDYLEYEFGRVQKTLEQMTGKPMRDDDLWKSIRAFNENRRLISKLYQIRRESSHMLSVAEVFQLVRAGYCMPPEEHNAILQIAIEAVPKRKIKKRDSIRIILEGSFCETPPIELLRLLDESGCAVVDDDLLLGRRWVEGDIPMNGNPVRALAENYLNHASYSSVSHDWRKNRFDRLIERIRNSKADAVVFCIAKFCEPALIDYPMFRKYVEREGIPQILLEFEEKMWTFESLKNDLSTFVESILFD